MNAELKARPNRLGIYIAVSYILIVLAVFAATALAPHDDGMEWIPFVMLAMPWVRMGRAQEFLLPGLFLNVFILYLLGTVFEIARRRILRR